MFARVLTLQIRLERRKEFAQKALAEILPIIRRSAGSVQLVVMQNDTEIDKFQILSIWRTREDIERYDASYFRLMQNMMMPYLTYPPVTTVYRLEENIPCMMCSALPGTMGADQQSKPLEGTLPSFSPSPDDETVPRLHRGEPAAGAGDVRTTP